MSMSPVELLRAAKALIADPNNWITGEYARASNRKCVVAASPDACMFCAIGALAHVAKQSVKNVEHDADFPAGTYLKQAAGERFPHRVNDDEGHAAVMAMYDRAIELAEAANV